MAPVAPNLRDAVSVPSVEPARLDLRRFIRPGDGILWSQAAGEPLALTAAFVEQSAHLGGVEAFVGVTYNPRLARLRDVTMRSYGALGSAAGFDVQVVPCHLSALPQLLASRRIRADVVFCQLSPADADGFHTLGVSVDYQAEAVRNARVVLAEINQQMPRTTGRVRVHASQLAASVHVDRPLIAVRDPAPTPVVRRIADRVSALVEDGATIQLGIGSVAAAVGRRLVDHRRLRVFSGLVGDWLVELADAGAIDSDLGPSITGTAIGTSRLYGFLHRNPAVEFRPLQETHPPTVTGRIPRFVAVNAALEVDLTGQVNAEVVAGRYLGATGGQVDYLRGAAASPGGLGIIALPSTTPDGGTSRIVAALTAPVTTARSDVHVVVTEHGVADLRGLSVAARATALLAIADPAHRAELAAAASCPLD